MGAGSAAVDGTIACLFEPVRHEPDSMSHGLDLNFRGDALGALVNALQGPVPLGTLAPPTVKSSQLSIVMETLLAHRVADIPKTLASPRLTVDHLDLLMQYVYKGIYNDDGSCFYSCNLQFLCRNVHARTICIRWDTVGLA